MDKKKNSLGSMIVIVIIFIFLAVAIGSCGSSGSSSSSSGKKWSQLSDKEKQNARDAYEMKQAIDKMKK